MKTYEEVVIRGKGKERFRGCFFDNVKAKVMESSKQE